VEVHDVELALLRGAARVEGVAVGGPLPSDGDPPGVDPDGAVLRLGAAAVEVVPWSLLRGEIRVRSLTLDALALRVERSPAGQVTALVLAEPEPEVEPEIDAAQGGGAGWPLVVDALAVREASLELLDFAEDGAQLLEFTLARFSLGDLAIRDGNLALGTLSLSEPRLRVRRDVALGRRTLALGSGAATPAAERSEPEPRSARGGYRIESLDIERAEFVLLSDAEPLRVAIGVSAQGVGLEPDRMFPAELRLEIEDGYLAAKGLVGAVPPAFQGTVEWSQLAFPLFTTAFDLDLGVRIESILGSGRLDVEAHLDPADEAGARLRLAGSVRNDDLRLVHDATSTGVTLEFFELEVEELFVPLPDSRADSPPSEARLVGTLRMGELDVDSEAQGLRARLAGLEVQARELAVDVGAGPGAPRAEIASVVIREPALEYTRNGGAEEAVPPGDAAPAQAEALGEPAGESTRRVLPQIRVARLEIGDGSIDFTDRSVRPYHRSRVEELNVEARGIRWPIGEADHFELRATGPGLESLHATGALHEGSASLELALDALDLPVFNPYTTPGGVRIQQGAATLRSEIGLREETFLVDSELVLDRLDLESHGSGDLDRRLGVPVDLGIALLQDASGRIRLPIAFEAGRDEMRAQLGATILAALRQAVVGAVSLPLKALRGVAGSGGDELGLALLPAAPGSDEPTEESRGQIAGLAELLARRPRLGLALHGSVGPEDQTPLRLQALALRVRSGAELPELDGVGFLARGRIRAALAEHGERAAEQLGEGDRAALDRYVAATPVPDPRRRALGLARAGALRAALLVGHGVRASRVRVVGVQTGAAGVLPELASVSALAGLPDAGEAAAAAFDGTPVDATAPPASR
jgi:hypothetical protein